MSTVERATTQIERDIAHDQANAERAAAARRRVTADVRQPNLPGHADL